MMYLVGVDICHLHYFMFDFCFPVLQIYDMSLHMVDEKAQ